MILDLESWEAGYDDGLLGRSSMHARSRPLLVFERLYPGSRMSCGDAGRLSAALYALVNPAGPATRWRQLAADHHLAAQKRDELAIPLP